MRYGNPHQIRDGRYYGTTDKQAVERKAEELRKQHPENKYEVAIHDHAEPHWLQPPPRVRGQKTWGVVLYTPYCQQVPFRCNGFLRIAW